MGTAPPEHLFLSSSAGSYAPNASGAGTRRYTSPRGIFDPPADFHHSSGGGGTFLSSGGPAATKGTATTLYGSPPAHRASTVAGDSQQQQHLRKASVATAAPASPNGGGPPSNNPTSGRGGGAPPHSGGSSDGGESTPYSANSGAAAGAFAAGFSSASGTTSLGRADSGGVASSSHHHNQHNHRPSLLLVGGAYGYPSAASGGGGGTSPRSLLPHLQRIHSNGSGGAYGSGGGGHGRRPFQHMHPPSYPSAANNYGEDLPPAVAAMGSSDDDHSASGGGARFAPPPRGAAKAENATAPQSVVTVDGALRAPSAEPSDDSASDASSEAILFSTVNSTYPNNANHHQQQSQQQGSVSPTSRPSFGAAVGRVDSNAAMRTSRSDRSLVFFGNSEGGIGGIGAASSSVGGGAFALGSRSGSYQQGLGFGAAAASGSGAFTAYDATSRRRQSSSRSPPASRQSPSHGPHATPTTHSHTLGAPHQHQQMSPQQALAMTEEMLEATRVKMAIPVLRRHLVEQLHANRKAARGVRKAQQQQHLRGGGGGATPPIGGGGRTPPGDAGGLSLGESVGRRSMRAAAVSFSGPSGGDGEGGGGSSASLKRRGTVDRVLLSLDGALGGGGGGVDSRRNSVSGGQPNALRNSSGLVESGGGNGSVQQQQQQRPEGPLYDPSDAMDAALVTHRAPQWLFGGEGAGGGNNGRDGRDGGGDPATVAALQRYLSIKDRQRRDRIVAKGQRQAAKGAEQSDVVDRTETVSPLRNGTLASRASVAPPSSSFFGGPDASAYSSPDSPHSQRSAVFSRGGGADEGGNGNDPANEGDLSQSRRHFYRVGAETKSGLAPANAPLGLDHRTVALVAEDARRRNAESLKQQQQQQQSLYRSSYSGSPFGGAPQPPEVRPSDLIVEGGGAAFVSSVAYNSPYVQGVLAPLLKQTRERERILENTAASPSSPAGGGGGGDKSHNGNGNGDVIEHVAIGRRWSLMRGGDGAGSSSLLNTSASASMSLSAQMLALELSGGRGGGNGGGISSSSSPPTDALCVHSGRGQQPGAAGDCAARQQRINARPPRASPAVRLFATVERAALRVSLWRQSPPCAKRSICYARLCERRRLAADGRRWPPAEQRR